MTEDKLWTVNPKVIDSLVDGEVVLLEVGGGRYYSLNAVGSAVWGELTSARSIEGLCLAISNEFEVCASDCRPDVERLIDELHEVGLVVEANGVSVT